jgi:hypothetical protein
MKHTIKMSLAVSALALVACGPGAKIGGGKQGAAEAMYAASGPTSGGVSGASPIDLPGLGLGGDIGVTCRYGGKATLQGYSISNFIDPATQAVTIGQSFTVAYDRCVVAKLDIGNAELNGSWTVSQNVATTTTNVNVEQAFKGKIFYNGAFNDFLDVDVKQTVAVTALNAASGGVSINLVGKVADTSGSYDFNEAVNVTAGSISVDLSTK